MAETESKQDTASGKGKAFFDRGDQVAETGNWDFAIQMYLEGIRREPGNLQRGHHMLREVSLKRKAQNGKPAGLMEKLKRSGGKDPVEALINAEYLLAKDPGNGSYMVAILKAAQKLDEPGVVKWIGEILLEVMRRAKKPSRQICTSIAEAFADVEAFDQAVAACDVARQAHPNDGQLAEMAKNYSAKATIKSGKYDGEASFTESVRDLKGQMAMSQRDHLAQSREFLEADIERARAEYQASPAVPGKIDAAADALLKIEEEAYENEAIDILNKAYRDSKAYRFKLRVDDIKIRQFRRRSASFKAAGEADKAKQAARELLQFELASYTERASNYPTDLSIKYQLGQRQLWAGKTDDAIVALQQAQREPKHRTAALNLLGLAFVKKGWHSQAVENFEKALQLEPTEQRAKELHYNMALALVAMGQKEKALDHFSDVAQLDFKYKDVSQQIERLRKELG